MNTLDLKYLLEDLEEHQQYEEYLTTHIENVQKAYDWIKVNLPNIISEQNYAEELAYYGELDDIIAKHDSSKYNKIPDVENYYELKCEYDQYAEYFYGEKTSDVKQRFNYAWLSHIHENPHHWQHWLLQNDDPKKGLLILDMPYVFIIEMIADWWSFSWKENNLYEIFDWYNKHKEGILLSDKTRSIVEHILDLMKARLNSNDERNSDAKNNS